MLYQHEEDIKRTCVGRKMLQKNTKIIAQNMMTAKAFSAARN